MTRQLESPLYECIGANYEIASLQSESEELRNIREKAIADFRQTGFPSIKNEEWRFTNIQRLVGRDYEVSADKNVEISEANLQHAKELIKAHKKEILPALKGEHKGAYRIVLINGKFNEQLSVLPNPEAVTVLPILQAEDEPAFRRHFGTVSRTKANPFAALNTALFSNGIFLEVRKNAVVDMPVHIINVWATECDALLQPRNLIVVNANAQLELIETEIAAEQHHVLVNAVTEIVTGQNAHFHHYDIQTGSKGVSTVSLTDAIQEKHSNYSNYTFTFPGSDFVRNNLNLYLSQNETESHLYGLYLTSGTQLVDNHTEVHHQKPHCNSNQMYKGVLMDKSRGVFNGKIYVYTDAQKTNAFQQSNNILLSDEAVVNTKPQLEIFADDVKCSHGTTVGQLNKDALFYLRSRGIGEQKAKTIMVNAFAFDVTRNVKIAALRNYLDQLIAKEMTKQ